MPTGITVVVDLISVCGIVAPHFLYIDHITKSLTTMLWASWNKHTWKYYKLRYLTYIYIPSPTITNTEKQDSIVMSKDHYRIKWDITVDNNMEMFACPIDWSLQSTSSSWNGRFEHLAVCGRQLHYCWAKRSKQRGLSTIPFLLVI